MFALAAIPGSLLIARLGAVRVAILGLAHRGARLGRARHHGRRLDALRRHRGDGCRHLDPAAGDADAGPALAADPHRRSPRGYTNGMLMGVTIAAALDHPAGAAAVGRKLARDLVVWSVPVLFAALLFVVAALRTPAAHRTGGAACRGGGRTGKARSSGCSASRSASTTRSSSPPTPSCRSTSRTPAAATLIGPTIGWLNGAQLIGSFMLLSMAERLQRPQVALHDLRAAHLLGVIGIVLCDGVWIVLSAAAARLCRLGDLRRQLRLAGDPQPARRGASHRRRHVHHQLHHRGDHADHLRRAVGLHRPAVDRVHADRPVRRRADDFRHDAERAKSSTR